MLLTYSRYLALLSALDEHTRCTVQKFELQNAIYNHYILEDGYIVAENAARERMIFYSRNYFAERAIAARFASNLGSLWIEFKLKPCLPKASQTKK